MTESIGITPMDHANRDSFGHDELMTDIFDRNGFFVPPWRGILSQADVEGLLSRNRLLAY